MAKGSDNDFPSILITEQASKPTAPAAGKQRIYMKTDHKFYHEDSGGTETEVGAGGVARSGSTTDEHLAVWNGSDADSIKDGGVVPAAGGRTLIGTEQTPSGTTTVTWSSIPSTYKKLVIEAAIRSSKTANNELLKIQMNTDTTASNYSRVNQQINQYGTGATVAADNQIVDLIAAASLAAQYFSFVRIEILQYANTGFYKMANSLTDYDDAGGAKSMCRASVTWKNTAAINQIDLVLPSGNFVSGSVLRLYGEN